MLIFLERKVIIISDMYWIALQIALNVHRNQLDKGGKPYINHPLEVSSKQTTVDGKIVGLLHDVVEDSDITLEDLRNYGFSENIVSAIKVLTRISRENYFSYIKRVKVNPLAAQVKLADLAHNKDLSRIPNPTETDIKRSEKYSKAIILLTK